MTWRRHGVASLAALVTFIVLTLLSHSWGVPDLTAIVFSGMVITLGYLHYRKRSARNDALPVTPARDDRKIPRDVRVAVILRDNGICQLRLPGCLLDKEIDIDHKVPYTWGGSSKDMDNLWCACGPCNRRKSNDWADMPDGSRLTRSEYTRMTGREVLL